MVDENLKRTPLNGVHRELGGRMVDFGGWDMPVQYPAGVIEEHMRTRTRAGLFDVSHMGEIWVEGPDAIAFVNRLTVNDVTKLVDGQAHYSALTRENGGVVDDLLVYKFGDEKLLLVVNAGTTEKDWEWITAHLPGGNPSGSEGVLMPAADSSAQDTLTPSGSESVPSAVSGSSAENTLPTGRVSARNASGDFCQIAVQGPEALGILQKLTETDLVAIKYYHFEEGVVDGVRAIISRTGYTGEDGFEIYADPQFAVQLWNKILETGGYGSPEGILPCGLAARNTLRLESAMSLYGHELDDDITPYEANLGWITKLQKGDFIGSAALAMQKESGLTRKIAGFEMTEPGIARDGYDVYIGEEKVGAVTSGSPAPFLKKNIGLAFLPPEFANIGQEIKIDVRGKHLRAQVVQTPFYKRDR